MAVADIAGVANRLSRGPCAQGTSGGLAIQLSASAHNQVAHEGMFSKNATAAAVAAAAAAGPGYRGAATHAFTQAIKNHYQYWGFHIQ